MNGIRLAKWMENLEAISKIAEEEEAVGKTRIRAKIAIAVLWRKL